ncbi:39S ribosomal protein L33, mitochondrial [Coemansia biformis]|uniref:Large ribosomal subunit protein uL30m n=1 Tax=Coemansia biformis TaxID=1286918 RepID=A0A9W7Y7G9_9FUNG|nr:39S ribosomal protein L33, mitochondrial [Coemansia biformis]
MFRYLARAAAPAESAQRILGSARAASGSSAPANSDGKLWKITLRRSPLGLHPRIRENARVLGLTRCGHTVYRPVSNELAGMIIKVKEIVKVELVDRAEPLKQQAPDGFQIIGRLNPQIAPGSKAAKPLLPLRRQPRAGSS